jgi:hypothetical protein
MSEGFMLVKERMNQFQVQPKNEIFRDGED